MPNAKKFFNWLTGKREAMITQQMIRARVLVYNWEIRRLGFQKTHRPRCPEKEEALVESAVAFLSTFYWEVDSDGVLRVKRRL